MPDELTLLRKENERLNQIISVLLEKITALQQQLYIHLLSEETTKMRDSSYVFSADKLKTFALSNEKSNIGEGNLSSSNEENNVGGTNLSSSNNKNNIGESNIVSANNKNNIEGNETILSNDKNNIGGSSIKDNIVFNSLYKIMVKCSYTSIWNAVKILKQLYTNSSRQSHKQLCSITGLSASGMAKHIRMLKSRGLITRTGYQQYALSPAALQIIERAML